MVRHANSGTHSPSSPAAPYYVRGLALGIPAILLGIQITGWLFFIPAIFDGHVDFRNFYSAGYMVRAGDARSLYSYETEKVYQDRLISLRRAWPYRLFIRRMNRSFSFHCPCYRFTLPILRFWQLIWASSRSATDCYARI